MWKFGQCIKSINLFIKIRKITDAGVFFPLRIHTNIMRYWFGFFLNKNSKTVPDANVFVFFYFQHFFFTLLLVNLVQFIQLQIIKCKETKKNTSRVALLNSIVYLIVFESA